MRNLLILIFMMGIISLSAQSPQINIAIINDYPPDNALEVSFERSIQEEILQLLQHRFEVKFKIYYDAPSIGEGSDQFEKAYAENDMVIAMGTVSTNYAISLNNYPKPTIGSIVLDAQLQGLQKTAEGTSGIKNFTYLESPFNMKRDLNLLYQIYPFDHLEVMTEEGTIGGTPFIKQLFANYLEGKNVTVDHIFYGSDMNEHIGEMKNKKVAVYALPYLGNDTTLIQRIFKTINQNKVPSAALFGEQFLLEGAFVGYETRDNLAKIPRRIALNVMKIAEGQLAQNLPVTVETFSENLRINMETARQIEIYPTFDLMSTATLINLERIETENKLTLQKAIAQALQNNLEIRIEQADVSIAQTEVGISKADLLPQVDVSTSFSVVDDLTALSFQGAQGQANWLVTGEISQLVFAEPVLANLTIQKLLKESEEQDLMETQLDVVINVANAYMNILFAKSNLNIQSQNLERTKENYDISKAKEAIGYAGTSDINRWEAELANANIEFNNAFASLRQARFQLNQLLNRPINDPVEIEEVTLEESMILITDERTEFIDNYGKLDQFANFSVQYALNHLPELSQIDLGLQIEKRLQLSRERAMYLPTIALSGSTNRVLSRFNIPEGLPPRDKSTTWNIGLGASYPIFQGNNRRKLIEQSRLNILQLQDTRKNVENQLELRIRANLELVGASYSGMRLARIAAEASRKNYAIVQDAYSAGQSNITNLIDAQNNALATELSALNAVYTFIIDFLTLERSIGYYNFLATPAERNIFFQELKVFFEKNK